MLVHVMALPYDSAVRGARMGAGPDCLLGLGLADELRSLGHDVCVEFVLTDEPHPAEVATAFALNRALAERVRAADAAGAFIIVLAGNCMSAVGTLAGLARHDCGVLWFDSHADYNTPETTIGGFLDGMALAVATGGCWRQLASRIPGFRAVPERHVVLLGTRAVDPLEQARLDASAIEVLPPQRVRTDFTATLDRLRASVRDVYVHLDLDVIDAAEGRANMFATTGGLTSADAGAALRRIRQRFAVRALAVTAYDPACDVDRSIARAAFAGIRTVLGEPAEHVAG